MELSEEFFQTGVDGLKEVLQNVLRTRTKQLRGPQTFLVPRSHIFVSYNHMDQYWLDRLLVHLRPLTRLGAWCLLALVSIRS